MVWPAQAGFTFVDLGTFNKLRFRSFESWGRGFIAITARGENLGSRGLCVTAYDFGQAFGGDTAFRAGAHDLTPRMRRTPIMDNVRTLKTPFAFAKHNIGAKLGIALLFAFSFPVSAQSQAALPVGDQRTPQIGAKAQYKILFSRDDNTCNKLRDFYNRHLHDYDSPTAGLLENQFGRELRGTGIEFLSERANWRPPGADLDWRQFLPEVDIYNDGSPRTVITQESTVSGSFDTQLSTVVIFKPGIDVNEAHRAIDEVGFTSNEIEQEINFWHGGSSLGPRSSAYGIEEVTPLPSGDGGPPVLGAIGISYQRLIRNQGQVYVIARFQSLAIGPRMDDVIRPNVRIRRGYLLVYSPTPPGIVTDVCVLEIAYTLSRR